MNKHLEVRFVFGRARMTEADTERPIKLLAPKYFATKFVKVFVENIPWLVEKLGIKVLPCVICFIDGVTKDRCAALSMCLIRAPRANLS